MKSFIDYISEKDRENFGEKFEVLFYRAICTFSTRSNTTASHDPRIMKIAKEYVERFIVKRPVEDGEKFDFTVEDESQRDKQRHYFKVIEDKVVLNKETDSNIGKYVTDYTVIYLGKKHYISLKANGTTAFGSIGLKRLGIEIDSPRFKIFMKDFFDFSDGDYLEKIVDKINQGNSAYYAAHARTDDVPRQELEDKEHTTVLMTKKLLMLLKKLIGHGYVYIWYDGSTYDYHMFPMTNRLMNKVVSAFSNKITLEYACPSNRITYFRFENPYIFKPRFELKDNHGYKKPDQIKFVNCGFTDLFFSTLFTNLTI